VDVVGEHRRELRLMLLHEGLEVATLAERADELLSGLEIRR